MPGFERGNKGPVGSTDMLLRAQEAARQLERDPTAIVSPGPDASMGNSNASPTRAIGDCGSEASALLIKDTWNRSTSQEQVGLATTDFENQMKDYGWIMTLYLGEDLGDPVDFAIRAVRTKRRQQQVKDPTRTEALASILYFLTGDTTYCDGENLYGIYNAFGDLLGIEDIRGKDVALFSGMPRFPKTKAIQTDKSDLKSPILETAAWHIKMGAEEGIDRVTKKYGMLLFTYFLVDAMGMIDSGVSPNSQEFENAIKRVNAAHASIIRVLPQCQAKPDFASDIETIRGYAKEEGIDTVSADIKVAATSNDEVFLGSWDPSKEAYGRNFVPQKSFGKAGRLLEDRTAIVYEKVLSMFLSETYQLVDTSDFIERQEIPNFQTVEHHDHLPLWMIFDSDGRKQVDLRPSRPISLLIAKDELHSDDMAEVTDEAKRMMREIYTLSYVYQLQIGLIKGGHHVFYLAGELLDGRYKGDIIKYRQPIYTDTGEGIVLEYLPANEEMEVLEVTADALEKNGFYVTRPRFATETILLNRKAHGDRNFAEFRKSIMSGEILDSSSLKDTVLQGMTSMLAESYQLVGEALVEHLSWSGYQPQWDTDRHLISFENEDSLPTFYYIDLIYDPNGIDERLREHGLTNWRIDTDEFLGRLGEIEAIHSQDNTSVDDVRLLVINALKQSATLFDPISKKVWLGKDAIYGHAFTQPIPEDVIPQSVAKIYDGLVTKLTS